MAGIEKPEAMRVAAALVLAVAVTLSHGPAAASDSLSRFLDRLAPHTGAIDETAIRDACGADASCGARVLAAKLGPAARLEPASQPGTDVIRWVETQASLGPLKDLPDGTRVIPLLRFGRKALPELSAALDGAKRIVIDLRGNAGGDFDRMLHVAAILVGPRESAVILHDGAYREPHDLPAVPAVAHPKIEAVLTGPKTASSAEVLAALLRQHAKAPILGERTAGKDYLLHGVPVDSHWRLFVPGARIDVPGENLSGGLQPDGALPLSLLAGLAE
jgi:hypothetical protein